MQFWWPAWDWQSIGHISGLKEHHVDWNFSLHHEENLRVSHDTSSWSLAWISVICPESRTRNPALEELYITLFRMLAVWGALMVDVVIKTGSIHFKALPTMKWTILSFSSLHQGADTQSHRRPICSQTQAARQGVSGIAFPRNHGYSFQSADERISINLSTRGS